MKRFRNTPFTFLIHVALAIIVAGAFVTHFCGIQGTVTLHDGAAPVTRFDRTSGPGDGLLPFTLALSGAEIIYYPGTDAPMDFRSVLAVGDSTVTVAMNAVAEVDGWRFYQSGMGPDSSTLSVSHDPWGIGITYTGYILLGVGMVGFFFQRRTVWRALLRMKSLGVAALLLLPAVASAAGSNPAAQLPAMQRPLAGNFGKVYVYWNDRVSPMQTMALDVTATLYGSTSYRGLTAEQVLSGWLFWYDEWLGDYDASNPAPTTEKERKRDAEHRALIQWLGTGAAFRIFPYRSATGRMEWLSLTGRRPSRMSLDQWRFMLSAVSDINTDLMHGRNIEANEGITRLIEGQRRYAGEGTLPSAARFSAERLYNTYVRLFPSTLLMFATAIVVLWMALRTRPVESRLWRAVPPVVAVLAAVWFGCVLVLRGIVGGHWPLSNGCENMLFMAFAASVGAVCVHGTLMRGALLLVGAMAAMVAAMAGKSPQIGTLMPVLASPLLSVHVMLVMCSYVLFMLMAVLSGVALCKGGETLRRLARVNAVTLVPAVFLLTAGIFVGAVWANQSWGRYWGWDPKETCALITMLIYAVPLHRATFGVFRRPRTLCIYLLMAIVSVLFTYFGANYLLPGLHSYA